MMRWVAAAAWAAVAAFAFSQFLANPFPMIPNDLGPPAFCLVAAGLVALHGRVGLIAAILSAAFGALVTVVFVLLTLGGSGSWFAVVGAAVLTAVNYLAAKQMNRTVPA